MNETHPSIEQIVDYLHGELTAPEDAALHAHLAGCRPCDELRAQEVALTELLRAQLQAEERELPGRVVTRIHDGIKRRRPILPPLLLLPAMVAAAAAVFVGLNLWHPAVNGGALDASYYVDNHAALAAGSPFTENAPLPAMLTSDDEAR
jgi:anti-sigma factor RsiW